MPYLNYLMSPCEPDGEASKKNSGPMNGNDGKNIELREVDPGFEPGLPEFLFCPIEGKTSKSGVITTTLINLIF